MCLYFITGAPEDCSQILDYDSADILILKLAIIRSLTLPAIVWN